MTRTTFSNHTAVRVQRADRDKIRGFYRGVLGCKLVREFADKDDFCIGDNFFLAFLYGSGDGKGADHGVNYASDEVLSDAEFMKAIFLELATDNVAEMRQRIVAFGVKLPDVPDPHLYFQAPGGQVWRLVGIGEDLSKYEGT